MNADIIDNYNDLPLGKWVEIFLTCRDESLEEIDRQVRIVSILTDKTEEEVLALPVVEYTRLAARLKFLEQTARADRKLISKNYFVGRFELIPVTDIRKITTSQYIDFQTFAGAGEDKIPEILSVFMVPKGKSYCKDYDIADVQDAIRTGMSVSQAFTLSAFFLSLCSRSIRSTLIFSRRMARKVKDKETRRQLMETIDQALRNMK